MRELKMKVYTSGGMIGPFDLSQNPMYWAHKLRDGERLLYTGLTDTNGVEIYEGDILKVSDSKEKFRSRTEQIKFSRGSFDFDSTELWQLEDDYNAGKIFYKVIGNIYENSELLEESK